MNPQAAFRTLAVAALFVTVPSYAQTKPAAKPATTKAPAKPAAKPSAPTPTAKPAPAATSAPQAPTTPEKPAPKSSSTKDAINEAFGGTNNELFRKGSTAVNLGVGFGLGYGYSILGNTRSIPALSVSVERGLVDDLGPGTIGVGALVGYKGYSWSSGSYHGTWSNIMVSARAAYHYNVFQNPKLDTYAGLSIGARMQQYSDNYLDDTYRSSYDDFYLTSGVFAGARYFLTDKIGAFGEVGYDMSYLKLGVTARF